MPPTKLRGILNTERQNTQEKVNKSGQGWLQWNGIQTSISKCKVRLRELLWTKTFRHCLQMKWLHNSQISDTLHQLLSSPSTPAWELPVVALSICLAIQHSELQKWFTEKNCWGEKKRLTNLMTEFLSLMNMNVSTDTRKEIICVWEQDWTTFLAAKNVCEISAYLLESFSKGEDIINWKQKEKVLCHKIMTNQPIFYCS